MIKHSEIDDRTLKNKIKQQSLKIAGNRNLKIYGTLSCKSGKRMKKNNRVFFASEAEAISLGFRPCGHCLREKYQQWTSLKKKKEV